MLLETERCWLKLAGVKDAVALLQYKSTNKTFFKPWVPAYTATSFDLDAIKIRLSEQVAAYETGLLLPLLVFLKEDSQTIVGQITYSQIQYGIAQMCYLGYSIAVSKNGKGLATEALSVANAYLFDVIGLHRIEANILPYNHASIRVVEKLGFEEEGLCKKLLKINGEWQDHLRFSLINSTI